jgi:hypothetical protein
MILNASRPRQEEQTTHDREVGSIHTGASHDGDWDQASLETLARFAVRRQAARTHDRPSAGNDRASSLRQHARIAG